MCSWPTRSQRVEAIGEGTGRTEESSEEFRHTDPRSLQSRHPERGSVLLIGLHSPGRSRGRCSFPTCMVVVVGERGGVCLEGDLLLHCLPGALSQVLSYRYRCGSRQGQQLTSQPGLPHPSQESRDDNRGPPVPAVLRRPWPGPWALQLVLKCRMWEGITRRQA